jgi:DNA-binding transcriptional LysR family regulator
MRLSSRQLEVFAAAYRHRSARLAAAALHVSQPAVSRMIADLEMTVGATLFDRSRRGFEPNFAASSLYSAVRRHHSGIERVVQAAQLIQSGTGGHVRIFALPVVADGIVASAAGILMQRHPALRFDIESVGEAECRDALLSGRADIAVMSTSADEPEFSNHPLKPLLPRVVMPASDELATRRKISIKDLSTDGLLVLPADSPFRQILDAAFGASGLTLRVRGEARTQSALLELVRQGAGRAIIHHNATAHAEDRFLSRPLAQPLSWPIVAVIRRNDAANAVFRQLLMALTKQ